jgi:hypothetical protein
MNALQKLSLVSFCCLQCLTLAVHGQQMADCGTVDSVLANYLLRYSDPQDLTRARRTGNEKLEYRLGLDINYQTYQLYNGDREKIIRTAHHFVQKASEVFEREINVKLTIAFIWIWDTPEPYPLVQDIDFFNNVEQYWTDHRPEPRDAVISFSSRGGWFYGGYRMCSSNFPGPFNSELEVDLFCHELGHTLGSPHTHSCLWPGGPIDRCSELEATHSLCQDGYREYTTGTLMSYCRSILTFHPLCQNLMRDYAEGKIYTGFRLKRMDKVPAAPQTPTLYQRPTYPNTPTSVWKAPDFADWYRVQISPDQDFARLVEDSLVRQSLYRSTGLGEGDFFIRVLAGNEQGASPWSLSRFFSIPPFSENSTSPLLLTASLHPNNTFSGSFQKYSGIDRYKVEVFLESDRSKVSVYEFEATGKPLQTFQGSYKWHELSSRYLARLRVRKDGVWSSRSEEIFLQVPHGNSISPQTQLKNVSSEPILATSLLPPLPRNETGFLNILEIATDPSFNRIIYRDSSHSGQRNTKYKARNVYQPSLQEHTDYFVRTRMQWGPGLFSPWNVTQLHTGFQDRRFQFLGVINQNFANPLGNTVIRNTMHVAGDTLFVAHNISGFYWTKDLKNWQAVTPMTSNGMSPDYLNGFGVGQNKDVYLFDGGNALVRKEGDGYSRIFPPIPFYSSFRDSQIQVAEKAGVFFSMGYKGVGHWFHNTWEIYDPGLFAAGSPKLLARRSDEEVWVLMEGGGVWAYRDGRWTQQPSLPSSSGYLGMVFDHNAVCFLYGTGGIMRLNPDNRQWESIANLPNMTVNKVVFDKQNQLWGGIYDSIAPEVQKTRLVKIKERKVTLYEDGLNFLNDCFDLAVFKDQLLILTNGGELHTFDETRIQRFEPQANYCQGDEVSVLLATNSTFGVGNRVSFSLQSTELGTSASIPASSFQNNQATLTLPMTLPQGRYRLRVQTTSPEVQSQASKDFLIHSKPLAEVVLTDKGRFSKQLSAQASKGQTYQWILDGVLLPGATQSIHEPTQSGVYTVRITNSGGCRAISSPMRVDLNLPSEITLLQNAPNPIGNGTEIAFYLPTPQEITLDYYSVLGQRLGQIRKDYFQAGWHVVKFEGLNLAPGMYLYQLNAGKFSKTLRMKK